MSHTSQFAIVPSLSVLDALLWKIRACYPTVIHHCPPQLWRCDIILDSVSTHPEISQLCLIRRSKFSTLPSLSKLDAFRNKIHVAIRPFLLSSPHWGLGVPAADTIAPRVTDYANPSGIESMR
jgi:hypothetical protein